MATTIPLKLKRAQIDGGAGTASRVVDFDTDTIKCGIWSAGAGAPDVTSTGVQFVSNITTNDATCVEMSATGYARQAPSPTGSVSFSGATAIWVLPDITFSQNASGFTTGRYAVIFKDTGSDATSPIICICDLGSNQSVQTGDLVLKSPAGGLIIWS